MQTFEPLSDVICDHINVKTTGLPTKMPEKLTIAVYDIEMCKSKSVLDKQQIKIPV